MAAWFSPQQNRKGIEGKFSLTFEFFTVRNFWQNLADLPNENKSAEIQQIREKYNDLEKYNNLEKYNKIEKTKKIRFL